MPCIQVGQKKKGGTLITKPGAFYELSALHPGFFAVRFTWVHDNHKIEWDFGIDWKWTKYYSDHIILALDGSTFNGF